MIEAIGQGIVAPGVTTAQLEPGEITVGIIGLEEHGESVLANCEYPDGFTKNHQTFNGIEELLQKIVNQLRGRYGAGEVKIISRPETVAIGESFTFEV